MTPATRLEWARFGAACVTLVIALIAAINPAALRDLLAAAGIGAVPVSVFSLILVLDFSQLYPWQYLTLPSAFLSFVLFLWLDKLSKEVAAGGNVDVFGLRVSAAIWLDWLRGLLVILWLMVAFYCTVRYMHAGCGLPAWMNRVLEWHFDPACPVDDPRGPLPGTGP